MITQRLAEEAYKTDNAGLIVAIIAAAISLASVIVAARAVTHAKTAADAAKKSAESSAVAAHAAEISAEADGKVAQVELARDHRELAPKPQWICFQSVVNERTGKNNLFAILKPPRTYLTHVDLVHNMGGRTPMTFAPSNVIEGGTEARVFVAEQGTKLPDELEIRLYPPTPGAPGEPWTCPCGEPVIGDHTDRGHWILRVKVEDLTSPLLH